ncbi:MAG TPA: peptide chain release factor 2 [Longimicrobiales bacterium]|nr:peptide chain release factor 2 [Longimicrobiales bacterium]
MGAASHRFRRSTRTWQLGRWSGWRSFRAGSSSSEVIFDVSRLKERLGQLEAAMAVPGFWDDPERSRVVIQEVKELKGWIEPFEQISRKVTDLAELGELMDPAEDPAMATEWAAELESAERALERIELRNMLRGADDRRDALLTIKPGAGGTESQDWAEMLMRMYQRWAESHEYEVELLDLLEGEEAGIKSATLEIRGAYAYGYLKAEKGVHRLVRISPFDSQARRHTSFASVFVYPVVDDDIEVAIEEKDLRIDTYRASGAGGQHVNKTSSAVRITHEPTGIVVACQQERSQFKNKSTAMKMLKAALYQRELELREQERAKVEATKTDIAWGNQIRSYVFQPYTMVTDHRTELKVGDVQRVMDGDLDTFIEAYLKQFGARAA